MWIACFVHDATAVDGHVWNAYVVLDVLQSLEIGRVRPEFGTDGCEEILVQ